MFESQIFLVADLLLFYLLSSGEKVLFKDNMLVFILISQVFSILSGTDIYPFSGLWLVDIWFASEAQEPKAFTEYRDNIYHSKSIESTI